MHTFLAAIACAVLLSTAHSAGPDTTATATHADSTTAIKEKLLGMWRWDHAINVQTGEVADMREMTMGLATEVRLEYKADNTYTEYKNKLKAEGFSTTDGEWKLEQNGTVIQAKSSSGKWRESAIISLTADTLVLEIRHPMHLVMVRLQ